MNGYFSQIIAVLKMHGFCLIRHGKGSHQKSVWVLGVGRVRIKLYPKGACETKGNTLARIARTMTSQPCGEI